MNRTFAQLLCTALLAVAMFVSCSRPVAYFQRGPVTSYATVSVPTGTTIAPVQQLTVPTKLLVPVNATVQQAEVYAQQDSKTRYQHNAE